MTDPLIGKFFSSYRESKAEPGARDVVWNGQICSRVKEGLYLVKLVNALNLVTMGIVSFDKQIMVPLEDMKGWELFDSREAWAENYEVWAQEAQKRSRRERCGEVVR
jgi:hypothetical protein